MKDFKVTKLDEDYLVIREYAWQRPETITVTITVTDESGNSTVFKEWKEQRKPEQKELLPDIYIFSKRQLEVMERNFKICSCPITQKGLRRYSLACGSCDSWYGQPARTAKALLKKGVPVTKELYGLFTHIRGEA